MRTALAGFSLLVLLAAAPLRAEPLAEKYLLEGKLADGSAALTKHLETVPQDDQARFGLGIIQFFQTFEHVGQNLYRYGLRTERSFLRPAPRIRELLPQNPNPEKIDYAAARKIIQTFVDDLNRAEQTLAAVKDPQTKLVLQPAYIKIDLFGRGTPVNAAFVLNGLGPGGPGPNAAEELVIAFDRGDATWLRGYCHFLAAWGEVLLAVDGQAFFDCTAHWIFERVETPHVFLVEDRVPLDERAFFGWNQKVFSDAFAAFHLILRVEVKEPERLKAAHAHLLATLSMSREMWKHYQAETDNDREWIPNPKQTGVLGIPVSQERIDLWLATVGEAEQVLEGKRLLPFWRGTQADRGVNLRRAFHESREIDIPLWIQGTAATPYLEKGEITRFADPNTIRRLNDQFRGMNFIGFAFWFN